jgi:hypothetical protein
MNIHQDIYTASALKEKYYDLFIKDMINRDHYIKIDGEIHKPYVLSVSFNDKLTKKELTQAFWYWMDEQMNILTAGISNINLKHLWKEVTE